MIYLGAYVLSTVGGYCVLAPLVWFMHRTAGIKGSEQYQAGTHRPLFRPIDVWIGFTERAIATTLFIWAPGQLSLFIGGWIAAKLAAGWGRFTGDQHAPGHSIALVGNAASFSIAIWAGFLVHPESLLILNAVK